jgi:hypothetical protein
MRVEQELKFAEEARISAEQDAAAQRYAANVLQVISQLDLFSGFLRHHLFPSELTEILLQSWYFVLSFNRKLYRRGLLYGFPGKKNLSQVQCSMSV